jgi:hypothetical protein
MCKNSHLKVPICNNSAKERSTEYMERTRRGSQLGWVVTESFLTPHLGGSCLLRGVYILGEGNMCEDLKEEGDGTFQVLETRWLARPDGTG